MLIALGVTFFNLALAEAARPELLTRTFDREILVKNIGMYHYHLYDAILQTKSSAQRALRMAELSEWKIMSVPIKKRLMMIFMVWQKAKCDPCIIELIQSFVINKTVNGEEITPF